MTRIDGAKLRPFILTAAVVLLDQISKAFIATNWPGDGVFIKDVFGNDFLWIIHVRNKAIAFSLGHALPDGVRMVLFTVLPLAVLALLVWYYLRTDEFTGMQRWAVAGIVGGGVGNLIDRIFRPDGVVDFISVNFYGLLGLSSTSYYPGMGIGRPSTSPIRAWWFPVYCCSSASWSPNEPRE